VNLSDIKTVFVDVDANEKLDVFDKQNYIESGKSLYESLLLKAGFNVITRDKIENILKEQSLNMAGLTRNEIMYKAGEIAGADAILFVRWTLYSDDSFDEEAKLVLVKSGEIALVGHFSSNKKVKPNQMREKLINNFSAAIDRFKKKAKSKP
jgi:hypothetical protein